MLPAIPFFLNIYKHANIQISLSVDWIFKRRENDFFPWAWARRLPALSSPFKRVTHIWQLLKVLLLATCHMNYCFFLVPRLCVIMICEGGESRICIHENVVSSFEANAARQ
jgi:hypothetical protein